MLGADIHAGAFVFDGDFHPVPRGAYPSLSNY